MASRRLVALSGLVAVLAIVVVTGRASAQVTLPIHNLSCTPNPAQSGQPVLCTAIVDHPANAIMTYVWDFGDGSPPQTTQTGFAHVYNSPGAYTNVLTASDSFGDFGQASIVVQVTASSAAAGCGGQLATICTTTPGITTSPSSGSTQTCPNGATIPSGLSCGTPATLPTAGGGQVLGASTACAGPTGSWIDPATNATREGEIHFSAYASSDCGTIDHVNFTLWWSGYGNKSAPWVLGCTVKAPTTTSNSYSVSGAKIYQCDADIADEGAPPQTNLWISFDVYDSTGHRTLSPGSERQLYWIGRLDIRMDHAADWTQGELGQNILTGWCEVFAEDAYGTDYGGGVQPPSGDDWASAADAFQSLRDLGLIVVNGDKSAYTGTDPSQEFSTSFGDLFPGTLVYFAANTSNLQGGHVGVYMGDGWMISTTPNGVEWNTVAWWQASSARSGATSVLGYASAPSAWQGR